MTETWKKKILLPFAVLIYMGAAHAQPRALGADFSFSGVSLVYEHSMNDECFLNFSLKSELPEVMMNRTDNPGISASVTSNFILASWKSRNDNDISVFFGPGISIGSTYDIKEDLGWFFGLKGRGGVECIFSRNVIISVALSPVIGAHLILLEDSLKMQYYKYGLLYSIMPEIGIKYRF